MRLASRIQRLPAVLILAAGCTGPACLAAGVLPPTNAVISITVGSPETARQLISWKFFEERLAGTFVLPDGAVGDYRFSLSGGTHGQLANGNLLVTGHPWYPVQAEVKLPSVLDGRAAIRTGTWSDITAGLLPQGWIPGGEAYGLGGLLQIGSRLYFTKYQWYNGGGYDWDTQGYVENGVARGMWNLSGSLAVHQRAGGYLSASPQILGQQGVTYLAGMEGTSGAADGRHGPNLFAIQFDDSIPVRGEQKATALLCHPDEGKAPPGWWLGNVVSDIKWIETPTHHGVLAFVVLKLGNDWYGEPGDQTPGDPYGGNKGFHASGYMLQAWIYDPKDLLDVYYGARDPWSVVPVEKTTLISRQPGSAAESYASFLTGAANNEMHVSIQDSRMIILCSRDEGMEPTPKGYVINLR